MNFILLFKGMQFLTGGILMSINGALMYYGCYTFSTDWMTCLDSYGPGARQPYLLCLDYLGNVMLVWLSFHSLHHSKNHALAVVGSDRLPTVLIRSKSEEFNEKRRVGGHLRHLLSYDVKCCIAS